MQTRRITTRGIIYKDGTLLAQVLKKRDGSTADYWCIPGGGLEPGESLHAGLHREMIEETGVAPKIGRLLYIQQYASGDREFLEFFFHVTNVSDYENINLAETSHGDSEIAECGFVDPTSENVLPVFLQNRDIARDIQQGTPVDVFDNLHETKEAGL